jgi:hypothetical protein
MKSLLKRLEVIFCAQPHANSASISRQALPSAHLPFLAKALRLTPLLALALHLAPDAAAADLLDDSTNDASIDSSYALVARAI